ncbi:hypothetical protein [Streptosporangium sp. NPDC051022]|uniref:hypothetical protein n=1 Tax=Streptosporangium sp. NPDC051022 TaxID=3155752 RepID=UPI00341F5EC5
MKIRRLSTAAVLAAMSAGVLAGATPAVASSQASATTASASEHPSLIAEQWYRKGPYPTLAACHAALLYEFTDLPITDCYYYDGDRRPGMLGYYYDIYQ